MPLPQASTIDIEKLPARPLPDKTLLWPSVENFDDPNGSDLTRFPSIGAIKARMGKSTPEPLYAFINAARNAIERIYVLDDFLFKAKENHAEQSRLDQILSWFPDGLVANDVRMLTTGRSDRKTREATETRLKKLFDERALRINQSDPRRSGRVLIDIRFTLGSHFDHVHDRFAIIDNELWHFGATVGGLHNRLNAASRGWDAEMHDAVRFFKQAWDAGGVGKGGR